MTYNKTTWNTGDVITADKLNNIETGLTDIFSIEPDYDSGISVPISEIFIAPSTGILIIIVEMANGSPRVNTVDVTDINKQLFICSSTSFSNSGSNSSCTSYIWISKGRSYKFEDIRGKIRISAFYPLKGVN